MSLSVQITPGYGFQDGEELTTDKLNALGNPTLDVQGGVDPSTIADGSVTAIKLATGAFSADDTGRAKMADGFLTSAKMAAGMISADVLGRSKVPDGAVATAKLASPALTADATGRAKAAQNFFLPTHFALDAGAQTMSGAATVDWSKGSLFRFTAPGTGGGAVALTQANPTDGQIIQILAVVPGPYFGAYQFTFADPIVWKGGVAPTLAALTSNTAGIIWLTRVNGTYYGWFKWPL